MIVKDKIIKVDTKTATDLNTFCFTIISNPNIPEYPVFDSISNDANNPVLKSILRYKYFRIDFETESFIILVLKQLKIFLS